jgi:Tfp pilus assembly protein PilF
MGPTEPQVSGRIHGLLPLGVLAAIVVVYLPSLSGGWVWDDRQLLDTPQVLEPLGYLTGDAWAALMGGESSLYRPLSFLSFWPGQALVGGPGIERVLSLLLHLLAVGTLAGIARALGASRSAAWLGAACFGLHPGSTEAVAWLSARQWELPTALLLLAWWAQLRRRDVAAALLLAVVPFFNEAFLVAPATAVLWMFVRRRFAPVVLVGGLLGALGYVVARSAAELPLLGPGLSAVELLGALGGILQRGLGLLLLPGSASPLARFSAHPAIGLAALTLAGMGCFWLLRSSAGRPSAAASTTPGGRSSTAALVAALLLIAPPAVASLHNGIIGDRYFYPLFAVLGLVFGLEAGAAWQRSKGARVLWLIPIALAMMAGPRAQDWGSNTTLFEAALKGDPDNPWAAFHRAHDLHVGSGDCEAAIPLYRRGVLADPRAANNLVACLLETGRHEEAAAAGPDAALAAPDNPKPALNTARALLKLKRYDEAVVWAAEGIARDPGQVDGFEILGSARGRAGDYEEAIVAFEQVLQLEPERPGARENLELAHRRLEEQRAIRRPSREVRRVPGVAGRQDLQLK